MEGQMGFVYRSKWNLPDQTFIMVEHVQVQLQPLCSQVLYSIDIFNLRNRLTIFIKFVQ